ncbi:hypothetical protein HU200_013077 [Digitaria exilis]|uniref:Chalcone synthase n=1 Tax=Digitaria exilis TaxID=1010633 RepID=A0A835KLB3_9POAL|nr:hypothetical protein HU200_013077 [Digitaria exilis]
MVAPRRSIEHVHGQALRPPAQMGRPAVLGIGHSNPPTCIAQGRLPADYYFRVTNGEHLTDLKGQAHQDLATCNPQRGTSSAAHPGLHRPQVTIPRRPRGHRLRRPKAIADWGRPATEITHLIFSTYSGARAPSGDRRLASLLGLSPTVSRTMLNLHGCYGGGRSLQLAKELAENNRGAHHSHRLLRAGRWLPGQTSLARRSSAMAPAPSIIGADPVSNVERPLFEMAFASQTTIPGTEDDISMEINKGGMEYHISNKVPRLLGCNVERCLIDAFDALGVRAKWNDLFWAIHPGGRAILDHIEEVLGLDDGKLAASRHVLSEFGNMSGTTVIFVLDELRRRRVVKKEGEALPEWGVMMAFGPGITIETLVLHAPDSLDGN